MAADSSGYRSVNPLFMKYTPSNGKFAGQLGYGYRSFEAFVDAVNKIRKGEATIDDFQDSLAMLEDVFGVSMAYVTYCNVETKQCRKAIENVAGPNGTSVAKVTL